jgi:hypothetical protein
MGHLGSRVALFTVAVIAAGVVRAVAACGSTESGSAAHGALDGGVDPGSDVLDGGVPDREVPDAADAGPLAAPSFPMFIDCGAPTTGATLPPGALASGQVYPGRIAVDDANVYWMNTGVPAVPARNAVLPSTGGQIMKCAKAGCDGSPTALVSGIESASGGPVPFAVAGASVYFDDDGTGIEACGLGGCGGKPAVVELGSAGHLAADPANVYWTGLGEPVFQLPIADGGMPTNLYYQAMDYAVGVAVDATDVYFVTTLGAVEKCAIGGCNGAPTTVTTGPTNGIEVALDADNVYWTVRNGDSGQVLTCPKSGCATPTVLVANAPNLDQIATDGVTVYFTELGETSTSGQATPMSGAISRCPVAGCGGMGTPFAPYETSPGGIAVDPGAGGRVYWTTGGCGGSVITAAK